MGEILYAFAVMRSNDHGGGGKKEVEKACTLLCDKTHVSEALSWYLLPSI